MRNSLFYCLLLSFPILILFSRCSTLKQSTGANTQKTNVQHGEIYAIKNVNIIPMTAQDKIIENATVVIKDRKILSINNAIPIEAILIDGKGKWLIAGRRFGSF